MRPCTSCKTTGQVTFDSFKKSYADVMREVKNDLTKYGSSRTQEALNSGSLKFTDCEVCNGDGRVPR